MAMVHVMQALCLAVICVPVQGVPVRAHPTALVCWGQGLGPAETADWDTEYTAVALGAYHGLALDADGVVTCWGENGSGQCVVPSGQGFTAIAAGFYHSLALRPDGSIVAWGDNTRGQRNIPSEAGFVAVAAGHWHSLAIRSDGSLAAWGWNEYGQCDVPAGYDFTAVCAGFCHSLALRSDGSLIAWGGNGDGQCDVPSGNDFTAIATGSLHNLALRRDGSLVAWGHNDYGQCKVPQGGGFIAIAAGAFHSLALKSDGSVVAWGYDSYGQCDVPPTNYVVMIAAGGFQSLAVQTDRPRVPIVEPVIANVSDVVAVEAIEPADANAAEAETAIGELDVVPPTVEDTGPADSSSVSVASETLDTPDPNAIAVVGPDLNRLTDANAVEPVPTDVNAPGIADTDGPLAVPTAVVRTDANAVEPTRAVGNDANESVAKPAPADAAQARRGGSGAGRAPGLYEGVEFYACGDANSKLARPVYHFTSETLTPHFYTISKEERDRLIDEHPDIWTYEGVAFYAYPEDAHPEGAIPVYRFWSSLLSTHFYTIDENEKNTYIKDYPDLCTYQGIAWYADKPGDAPAAQDGEK
ncbi:MAG TPA: hypothetical protein PLU87_08565 [Sedimentisphaerales bacterium]|nr:hypothetical protein [Sedimentisphaerales bacterium]HRS10785.1 hypothetical protein [Sedimentisphaerales bacterium]HRV47491.1 hypothetical protein [Sedimentisphaerales bacterium]